MRVSGIGNKRKVRWVVAVSSVCAAVTAGGGAIAPSPARAGTLWLQVGKTWNTDCSAFFGQGGIGVSAVNFCSNGGMLVAANAGGGIPAGARAAFQTNAPAGITINHAWIPCNDMYVYNVNNNQGWGGGDYYAGGGSQWTNGQTCHSSANFNSSYYGFQLICGSSTCNNQASIDVAGIELQATENSGPGLLAIGSNNLWYQAQPGRYIRGAGWPLTYSAADVSGVCAMSAWAGSQFRTAPVSPTTSQWHQCPDQTLPITVDTRTSVPTSGPLQLTLAATNAGIVRGTV